MGKSNEVAERVPWPLHLQEEKGWITEQEATRACQEMQHVRYCEQACPNLLTSEVVLASVAKGNYDGIREIFHFVWDVGNVRKIPEPISS